MKIQLSVITLLSFVMACVNHKLEDATPTYEPMPAPAELRIDTIKTDSVFVIRFRAN